MIRPCWVLFAKWMEFSCVIVLYNKRENICSLIMIYLDVSIRCFLSVFDIRCFIVEGSWGIPLGLQRYVRRSSTPQRLQYFRGRPSLSLLLSFHEVAYLCITSPVFGRFLRYWQVNIFRNIFACRFLRHACFTSFIKMTKCVYVISYILG